jgi:hypothetical protein
MTTEDAQECVDFLTRTFKKMEVDERLERFQFKLGRIEIPLDAATGVILDHALARGNYSNPNFKDLLAALEKAGRPSMASERPEVDQRFAAILKRQDQKLAAIASPTIRVMVYWRGQYIRYMNDLNRRMEGVPPGPALERAQAGADGMQRRVVTGCTGSLVELGVQHESAEIAAAYVTTDPHSWRLATEEIERDGLAMVEPDAPAEERPMAMEIWR